MSLTIEELRTIEMTLTIEELRTIEEALLGYMGEWPGDMTDMEEMLVKIREELADA